MTGSAIDRGLHHSSWLSAGKVRVLESLAESSRTDLDLLRRLGCHRMSIVSVRDAGYIELESDPGPGNSLFRVWAITPLGREALGEYKARG